MRGYWGMHSMLLVFLTQTKKSMEFFTFTLKVHMRKIRISEKAICHQASKIHFYKLSWKMPSTPKFYYRKSVLWGLLFWKPDDRCLFQLILICLMYNCKIKVKRSMHFLVWVEKTRGTLCADRLFSTQWILDYLDDTDVFWELKDFYFSDKAFGSNFFTIIRKIHL